MSGCTPRSAETTTVPRMPSSKPTAKHSSVPINVTTQTRTGMECQRGAWDGRARAMSSASILRVRTFIHPVGAAPAKRVDGPGPSLHFAAVQRAAGNEALLSRPDRGSPVADNQRVAALNDNHVFVEVVHMRRRGRGLGARPECHLAPIQSIKHIPFDTGSPLAANGDPVGGMLHEIRKLFHKVETFVQNKSNSAILNPRSAQSQPRVTRGDFRSAPHRAICTNESFFIGSG